MAFAWPGTTQPGSEEIQASTCWRLTTIIDQIFGQTGVWCLKITKDDKLHAFATLSISTRISEKDTKTFMI